MAAKIVEDDDVAGLEGGNQLLLDVGPEALSVDRAVEDARCSEPVAAQGAEKGQGAPAPLGRQPIKSLALSAPTAQWRHVGADPGLIDEDQPVRVEAPLPGLPASAPAGHVWAELLKGEQAFF